MDENIDEQVVNDNPEPIRTNVSVQETSSQSESEPASTEPEQSDGNKSPRKSERDKRPNSRFRDFFLF